MPFLSSVSAVSSNLKPAGTGVASGYIAGDRPESEQMIEHAYRCETRIFENAGFIGAVLIQSQYFSFKEDK